MINRLGLLFLLFIFFASNGMAQTAPPPEHDAKMKWFKDAKFGIFVHWGIYAVNGIDESWSFFNGYISQADYLKQARGFTAKNYDPNAWAQLFKESGARYAVLTTKHHDGIALWDTKQGGLNTFKDTPAKRDLVAPFVKALRDNDLKVGLYFSLPDWSYPDYDVITRTQKRYTNDPTRWQKFLNYYQGQLKEVADNYDPDLYWFDGDWEHSAAEWQADKMRQMLLTRNPQAIMNSRLAGAGDYGTPENAVPISRPADKYWELCFTINDSWGYQPHDTKYKSSNQLIRVLADTISMGGNLLLSIGPKPDGSIPAEQVQVLKDIGRWTSKHSEAIYGTEAGIPHGHFYGPTALSSDREKLYLFLDGKPNGPIAIKGLKNKINRIYVVGQGTKLSHTIVGKQYWSEVPGIAYIDVPDDVLDKDVTVIAVMLDKPVELYREKIRPIESN